MLFTLTIIVCILLILHRYLNSTFDYWKKRNVPHDPPVTFFGNLFDSITLKKSLGQLYTKLYNSYKDAPYVGFYKMRTPGILVRDPAIIRDILIKDFNSFDKNDFFIDEDADPIMSRNPFFLHGERWKVSRGQLSFCFSSGKIKSMFPLMHEVAKNMVKYVENEIKMGGNPMEAKELTSKYTCDNVATCAFGLESKSFENPNSEFREMGRQIFQPSFSLNLRLLLISVFPICAKLFKVRFVPENVGNYFRNIVKGSLKYRQENNIVRNDFLDVVSQMKFAPGEPNLSNEDITAHALSFFADGFETSSTGLTFALYNIAANMDVQQNLKREIDEVLKKYDGNLCYEAIQDMNYLDCVLSESLRMHSPGSILFKLCTKEYNLPPCTSSGESVKLEVNTPIALATYGLHHDPKYFPDPEKFDPSRFSENNKSNIVKGSYLPFGEGPRMCIGMRFAVFQIKVAIVALVQEFEIQVNKKTKQPLEIDPKHLMLLAKGGIWLDYSKRTN